MPRKTRDVESLLQSKYGFTEAKERSRDHRWYGLNLPGLPTIATKFSHSNQDINPALESKIARQLRVRKPYFVGMVDCTHSKQDYYRQVQQDPFPPFDVRF